MLFLQSSYFVMFFLSEVIFYFFPERLEFCSYVAFLTFVITIEIVENMLHEILVFESKDRVAGDFIVLCFHQMFNDFFRDVTTKKSILYFAIFFNANESICVVIKIYGTKGAEGFSFRNVVKGNRRMRTVH